MVGQPVLLLVPPPMSLSLQSKEEESVKVVVRCRPLLPDEVAANYTR